MDGNRIAIKVLKKYPDGEAWLGKNGSPGEWAVTYHGTTKGAFNSICKEGFWIGDRKRIWAWCLLSFSYRDS